MGQAPLSLTVIKPFVNNDGYPPLFEPSYFSAKLIFGTHFSSELQLLLGVSYRENETSFPEEVFGNLDVMFFSWAPSMAK